MDPPVAIRPARELDLPWIYSSFIKSLSNQRNLQAVEPHLLAAMLHGLCTRLLGHGTCLVACDPADDDQAYGYVMGDAGERLLYWAYIKNDFRGFHVGRRLLDALCGDVGGEPIGLLISTSASRHLEGRWRLQPRPDLIGKLR
jgi:ribosomal protein S18 acetylase RimI-like enzyme